MLTVSRYVMAEGAAERVADVAPRHRAFLDEFARSGQILLIGPLDPVPTGGAMGIFRSREAAEAFEAGDPFVLEGLAIPAPLQAWSALELT